MTVPNLITVARLFLVPLIIIAIGNGRWVEAFVIFVVAGVSDAVDGFLAKRFDMASELGAHLDPIADKALIVSIYVTLAVVGVLPVWLAVLVLSRDIMIVAAVIRSWLLGRRLRIAPLPVSKLNTAVQLGFAAAVLGSGAFGIDLGLGLTVGQFLVALLTLGSMAAYLAVWLRHMTP